MGKSQEKTDELRAVEAEYGFVFGTPDGHETAAAPRGSAVSCTNPECPAVHRHVQLHADTVQPVLCGSCGSVLLCDHADQLPVLVHGGTFGAPILTTNWTCVSCQTVVKSATTELPPLTLDDLPLADIPAAAAAAAARHTGGR